MSGKKLLILSDSHGNVSNLTAVLNWAKDRLPPNDTIAATAFCGDGLSDLHRAADATGFCGDWKLVGGNNDYDYNIPETAIFDFCDHRFFMCHGYRHNIYSGYYGLIAAAKKNNANVVLFGHTHIPCFEYENGILLINPGSISRARSRLGDSFAVLECIEGQPFNIEFWGIGDKREISLLQIGQ